MVLVGSVGKRRWAAPRSLPKRAIQAGTFLPLFDGRIANLVIPIRRLCRPGPDNPLGKFVLKLDLPGYLIHGTNQPYGVGMRVSHGCVRLYPENIELLYELVGLGEPVIIINEPYLAGQRDGDLFFEGHTPLVDDAVSAEDHLLEVFASLQRDDEDVPIVIDQEHVRAIAAEALGVPVRFGQAETSEVLARARVIRNTVEPDPNMPTLEEVRALLDEPIAEEGVAEQAASMSEWIDVTFCKIVRKLMKKNPRPARLLNVKRWNDDRRLRLSGKILEKFFRQGRFIQRSIRRHIEVH